MTPTVLYLSMIEGNPSHKRKLAGIRRYCATRGWDAVPIYRRDIASASDIPAILQRYDPAGCIVEGVASLITIPPRIFRKIPVSYIGYPKRIVGNCPNSNFDTRKIVETAFAELSASKPSCYAAVGFTVPHTWSRTRVNRFREVVVAAGGECQVFQSRPIAYRESFEEYDKRLAAWLANLPNGCAIFAASDEVAVRIIKAAHETGRSIPGSLTLVSVDNFEELSASTDPPVTSIELDFEFQGYVAAKAMAEGGEMAMLGPLLAVRRKSTFGRGRSEPWILEAIETIRREACDGLTPARLVARFKVSKSLFNLRFREARGHSALDEITHVRLEKAMTLLAQTDTAIGAIPSLCGFRCYRSLDAVFRAKFGMGMRDWRKRHSL